MNAPLELPACVAVPQRLQTVLAVDDTPANLGLLSNVLAGRYRVQVCTSGTKALEIAARQPPDLVILDVMMPGMDGYEVCRRLKEDPRTHDVPVLFLTALNAPEDETRCLQAGGADFIQKPFNPATLLARVATQMQLKAWSDELRDRNDWLRRELETRLAQLDRLRDATMFVMVSFAEFRDEDTGNHVKRTQEYVRTLGRWLARNGRESVRLSAQQIDEMARSAPLHDIGKVAIPDNILLKPGPLTAEEFEVMKRHTVLGWDMLRRAADRMDGDGQSMLRYGLEIARHHHEKWNGRGYPDGLAGDAIPLSARLMAAADVYDALISRRPYKDPMSHEQAVGFVEQGAGAHFDPEVAQALVSTQDELREIARKWQD